ncbi:hypothetical protein CDAR_560531 [Caerostris darwini]|uniref:Uncharacterized protein n=1 Tax=Caerostris darwini TaxID=1538125 RepID=A0AAV4VZW5_9ARAC|nr:hypothetical protein CDAR_560271 [Caerostris darwini]GIY75698.1 hypothetical protein CDAR_560531 [Caerostris darwini]
MAENDEATTSKSLVSNFWRLKTKFKTKHRPKVKVGLDRHFPLGFARVYCPNLSLLENSDVGRKKKKRTKMAENDEATTSKSLVSNFWRLKTEFKMKHRPKVKEGLERFQGD